MPKNTNVIEEKPNNSITVETPTNTLVLDAKPKNLIMDSNIEEYENFTWDLTAGMWMGNPFFTYPTTQTVTGKRPKGGNTG